MTEEKPEEKQTAGYLICWETGKIIEVKQSQIIPLYPAEQVTS